MQRKDFIQILKRNILPITVACTILGCSKQQEQQQQQQQQYTGGDGDSSTMAAAESSRTHTRTLTHTSFSGLVDMHTIDTTIVVDLKYSTTDNFVGVDVYGDLESCYLQPQVAQMLAGAQRLLVQDHPHLRLLIFDCARPLSVQQILWDTLQKPEEIKHLYVADPKEGSIHNYGSAVDLTIADQYGQPLDMGTDYDHFGPLAYPSKEAELLASGELTQEQIDNRELLREVMTKSGFTIINTEWWHFNAFSRKRAQELFEIIE